MDASWFSSASPGRLTETEIGVRRVIDGVPQIVRQRGLAFVPGPLPPAWDWMAIVALLHPAIVAAERAVARLAAVADRLENPHLLLRPLLTREVQLSSTIENTIASHTEIALEAAGAKLSRNEPREVLNYIRATDHVLGSDYPFGGHLIHEAHRLLMQDVADGRVTPGEVRTDQNLIGRDGDDLATARFVPPPPGPTLHDCLHNLYDFLNNPPAQLTPLVVIGVAHYQFEAIHPFRDGNGRIGRLLVTLCLARYGLLPRPMLYVSAYIERHRQRYYDLLLAVSTKGAWAEWLSFFLQAVETQAIDAAKRAEQLAQLRQTYLSKVTRKRASALTQRLIDNLFAGPVVSIPRVAELLGVGYPAANRHMAALIEAGVVQEVAGSSHPKLFVASGIIAVAEGAAIESR